MELYEVKPSLVCNSESRTDRHSECLKKQKKEGKKGWVDGYCVCACACEFFLFKAKQRGKDKEAMWTEASWVPDKLYFTEW